MGMRVLLITDWNPGRGGAEAYVAWLHSGLKAAGNEVCLLTSSAGTAGDGRADQVAFGTRNVAAQVALQILNPFAVARVRKTIATFRPDVVHVHLFAYHLSPAILFALDGVPFVMTLHDYKNICPTGRKLLPDGRLCTVRAGWVCCGNGCVSLPHWVRDLVRYPLIRAGIGRASRILVYSRTMEKAMTAEGLAVEYLPLPLPPPGPGFVRVPASTPLFLYCGRLEPEKGVGLLLQAWARLIPEVPGCRLRLCGAGSLHAALLRLAGELGVGDTVEFLGWQDPVQIERQLAETWALVAPSLWAEPFGLVAPEAVLRRVPVIASATGGLGESIVPGESGLLFENGDENGLARHLVAVARREVFPNQLGSESCAAGLLARHELGQHIGGVEEVYRRLKGEG